MADEHEQATEHAVEPPTARAAGYGPVRVLALAVAFALIIGAGGFVASRTVARNRAVVAPMCIDSQCTSAMSADSSSSMTMSSNDAMNQQNGMMSESDVLGQALSDLLRMLHLR